MTDLPPLFDKRGVFMPLDGDTLANLSPERQRIYQDVADAAAHMERADAELVACNAAVKLAADQVRDAEKAMPAKRDFHSLWKETFGRPRVKAEAI